MSKGTRIPWETASAIAERIVSDIKAEDPSIDIRIGGSVARKRKDCGDIDLCLTETDHFKLQKIVLRGLPICDEYSFTKGTKKVPGRLSYAFKKIGDTEESIKVEFYIGKNNALGAIQLFCNGSGMFNVRQRRIALRKGFKLSQYGLFDVTGAFIAGKTEEEIFEKLGMKFLTPQEREEG